MASLPPPLRPSPAQPSLWRRIVDFPWLHIAVCSALSLAALTGAEEILRAIDIAAPATFSLLAIPIGLPLLVALPMGTVGAIWALVTGTKRRRYRWFSYLNLALLLFLLLLVSLSMALPTLLPRHGPTMQQGALMTVRNATGEFALEIPVNWQQQSPSADRRDAIAATDDVSRSGLRAFADAKVDLVDSDLAALADLYIQQLATNLDEPTVASRLPTKIGSHSALECMVTGSIDRVRYIYLITIIDSKDYILTVIGFTKSSRFDQQSKLLKDIASTFRHIPEQTAGH